MAQHTNRLIEETSPYLLQHAHNPVDWYAWSEEALAKAQSENKPILVSIGYSACHWCHVMEKESFEDESTAAIMNEHFINIKIDREERPDLDHIYMDAVQAMTGSGGWPLNVFLTPDARPFYGGTYFPPKPAFNRPSWKDVLNNVAVTFKERRHEVDAQAENLTEHLKQSNSFGTSSAARQTVFTEANLQQALDNVMKTADKDWGGFGRAPKFPQTFTIQFLLRNYYVTGSKEAVTQALLSIDKMIEGGIYDQVCGGFARYATDTEWLAPHFERMLYDNALLVSVLSEAFQLTRQEKYKKVIDETVVFLKREMMHPGFGFYAAIDADSEGEEGRFYVWTLEQIKQLLGNEAAVFCRYYDITETGNWEGKNILRRIITVENICKEFNITPQELQQTIDKGKSILLHERNKRTRPGLDNKIILGWNALLATALSKAYAATGNQEYKQLATENMRFLLTNLQKADGSFYHSWKDGKGKALAFLDDYAYLVQALLSLQEISGDRKWLEKAITLVGYVIDKFSEEDTGYFFYTEKSQADVIIRKKELYDGATPSANSVMAENLYKLSILLSRNEWKQRSEDMISALGPAIIKYPTSFGVWVSLIQEITIGTQEIAIIGPGYESLLKEVMELYLPHKVIMGSAEAAELPLLAGKMVNNSTLIYLCQNYSCQHPVQSCSELIALINSGKTG